MTGTGTAATEAPLWIPWSHGGGDEYRCCTFAGGAASTVSVSARHSIDFRSAAAIFPRFGKYRSRSAWAELRPPEWLQVAAAAFRRLKAWPLCNLAAVLRGRGREDSSFGQQRHIFQDSSKMLITFGRAELRRQGTPQMTVSWLGRLPYTQDLTLRHLAAFQGSGTARLASNISRSPSLNSFESGDKKM